MQKRQIVWDSLLNNMNQEITFFKGIKAAWKGGLIAAGINIAWLFGLEYFLNLNGVPKGFPMAVVFSSILPLLLGSLVYVVLIKNFLKGEMLFLILAMAFTLFSLFPSFQNTLPNGDPVPEHFVLLTLPMHFVTVISGLFFLLKRIH